MKYHSNHYANYVLEAMQALEELGGPDFADEYILILTIVRTAIDERIANAIKISGNNPDFTPAEILTGVRRSS